MQPSTVSRLLGIGLMLSLAACQAGGTTPASVAAPPSATASPTPARLASPTAAQALAPESLRSTWLSVGGPAASAGGQPGYLRLVVGANGTRFSVFDGGVETFMSTAVTATTTEFDLVSTSTDGGCQVGDLGRYGYALASDGSIPNSDGTRLALTVIADACSARSATLNRGWTHAIDAPSKGGRGVSTAFTPLFFITMPAADYQLDEGPDSLTLTSSTPDRTLFAVKNPVGWTDPCASTRQKLQVAPTIKAFTSYLRTLPGFTVQSTSMLIDGRPAAHLITPSTQTADCPGNRVYEWSAAIDTGSGAWLLNQGETDVLYLVEVDGNLILLQWLGQDVASSEELALFQTVHFTDTLPQ